MTDDKVIGLRDYRKRKEYERLAGKTGDPVMLEAEVEQGKLWATADPDTLCQGSFGSQPVTYKRMGADPDVPEDWETDMPHIRTCSCGCQVFQLWLDGNIVCDMCMEPWHNRFVYGEGRVLESDLFKE